ncbi:MAG: hypothetical protein R2815_13100 [Flavobacteriales bacterium]
MGSAIAGSTISSPEPAPGIAVLEHSIIPSPNPHLPGKLEVVKLLNRRWRTIALPEQNAQELVLAARPASRSSSVHWVHFRFQDASDPLPAPELEYAFDRIRLYYPLDQFDQIQQVLRTYRDRFCYFWQAGDASRVRAWLFTPH